MKLLATLGTWIVLLFVYGGMALAFVKAYGMAKQQSFAQLAAYLIPHLDKDSINLSSVLAWFMLAAIAMLAVLVKVGMAITKKIAVLIGNGFAQAAKLVDEAKDQTTN